jgi:hypothetical protein
VRLAEPAVSRRTLVVTAALVWSAVGVGLSVRAAVWFVPYGRAALWMAPLAVSVGLLKAKLVLGRLADRNLERIRLLSPHKERICVFAFQSTQSFLIVLGMVAVGVLLRVSPLPRDLLATVYLAIGTALLAASRHYWRAASQNG